MDRPDLQCPDNELARWKQAPTVGDMQALNEIAKYLIGHTRRLIQEFARQVEEPCHLVVFTDSDHARCVSTLEKNLFINNVSRCQPATYNQHHASDGLFECGRMRALCHGKGDVS